MDYKEEIQGIKRGGEYINESLANKGLSHEAILFFSLNYNRLVDFRRLAGVIGEGDVEEVVKKAVVLNEAIVRNDKNVINVVFLLLKNLEAAKQQQEEAKNRHVARDAEIGILARENLELRQAVAAAEARAVAAEVAVKVELRAVRELRQHSRRQKAENEKLRQAIDGMKAVREVEIRKKDAELSAVQNRLIGHNYVKRKLVLYENVVEDIVDEETRKLMVDSSDLISNLGRSNRDYARVLINCQQYLVSVVENKAVSPAGNLAKNREEHVNCADLESLVLETLEEVYQYVLRRDVKEASLRQELEDTKESWERAIETMEKWREYAPGEPDEPGEE